MTRWCCVALWLVAACRAAPIPPSARYPAGSAFTARSMRVLGTNLRYIDAGRGVPVIFLHGLGASIYSWRHNLGAVAAAGFRVVAFDNRGFGFSDKPDAGYGNADYVKLLLAFMDSLHLSDAVLVGQSMGGAIAADAALTQPGRVRGLVLIDAAGLGIGRPWLLVVLRSWAFRVFLTLRGRWVTALALKSAYANPSRITSEDIDQYYAPAADPRFGHALGQVFKNFRFDDLRGRLATLDIPTLVLWGDEDTWIPKRIGTDLASQLLRVAFVPIPNTGHVAQEESPDLVNRPLIEFLEHGIPPTPADLALRHPER